MPGLLLNFSCLNIEHNISPQLMLYKMINNSRYWLGRSQYWNGSYDGRIAEVITYSARKDDVDLCAVGWWFDRK